MNFLRAQCRPGGRKLACQNQLDLFSRFDRTPTCDGETDTASTGVSTALRGLTCLGWRGALPTELVSSSVFTHIAALGTLPPAERGPSLESIYSVSFTVIFATVIRQLVVKPLLHHSQLGLLKKKKIRGAGHVPSVPIG